VKTAVSLSSKLTLPTPITATMNTSPPRPVDGSVTSRAELAGARAYELRQRREELARGVPATKQTADFARSRAQQALERAGHAHRAAAARHLDAGRAHWRAAAAHEQAAMMAGDGEGEAHQDAAAHHREEALRHDAAAAEEFRLEADDACRRY
jgi:hypothetical protein